jgi:hypothetical protein
VPVLYYMANCRARTEPIRTSVPTAVVAIGTGEAV